MTVETSFYDVDKLRDFPVFHHCKQQKSRGVDKFCTFAMFHAIPSDLLYFPQHLYIQSQ